MTPQRILIIKHGALGDLIQSFGLLQGIRESYPHAHITLLTAPAYQTLMALCPWLDAILIDQRRPWFDMQAQLGLRAQLKCANVDCVIDLQNSDRTRWYRLRWFRRVHWIGRGFFAPAPTSGLSGLEALLTQHGITTKYSRQADLSWLLLAKDAFLRDFALTPPYVVFIPGSSAQHPEKRWPYYAQLAQNLATQKLQVLAVLGPDEQALAKTLSCRSLSALSWQDLSSLFAYAHAVVGNDTGPSHLAAHLGATGLALFGATTSAQRAELNTEHFYAWQVADLQALPSEVVAQKIVRLSHKN